MIEFACAVCGKAFTVPDEAAGRVGKCSNCGERNRVPGGAAFGVMADDPTDPSSVPSTPIESLSTAIDGDAHRSVGSLDALSIDATLSSPPNVASPSSNLPPFGLPPQLPRSPLTVGECATESLPSKSDPEFFPQHAIVDFGQLGEKQIEKKSKRLKVFAEARGWLHQSENA
jgi:hypothetical protein